MVLAIIGRFGAKFSAKILGKTAGKTVFKTVAKTSFKRFGVGAMLGGGGMLGLTSLLNSNFENGILNGVFDMINPLNGGANMILFIGVVGVVLFIISKLRRK